MIVDKASIARFIGLIVGLLAYFGINVPESFEEGVVSVLFGLYVIYTSYKNNDFTKEAKAGTEYMKKLKSERE